MSTPSLVLQQKLQGFLTEKGFKDGKYQLPAILEKDGSAGYQCVASCRFNEVLIILSAGFDVDGKIQAKVQFSSDSSNRDYMTFEFSVIRAGDDPMVTMNVTMNQEYGQHGSYEIFEVTLTDKKQIENSGW
jgi:hypothetical protein